MLICNKMKQIIFLLFISSVCPYHLHSATIFAISSIRPRLLWRNLTSLPADIHFSYLNSNWDKDLLTKIREGEVTIIATFGPDTQKVINRLIKNQVAPDWIIAINPGCISLPKELQVARFSGLFSLTFPLIGRWWIRSFILWAFKPRSPEQIILNSYLYYWGQSYKKIPSFFNCAQLKKRFYGKSLIFVTSRKSKYQTLLNKLPLHITIKMLGLGLFPQETASFYVNGIFSAILNRRIR